jgi:2',3'-cyclic-nucleotide 2'-phosphodiesterase (5'-nucleotidase family)
MRKLYRLILVFVFLVASCGSQNEKNITILITGNNLASLEPCGCRPPIGGLPRKAAYLQTYAKADLPHLKLEGGNWLFPSYPSRFQSDDYLMKVALLQAESYQSLQYDAINIGSYDLQRGLGELKNLAKSYHLPFISANLKDKKDFTVFPGHLMIRKNGLNIAVIGLTDAYANGSDFTISDAWTALDRELSSVRKKADIILVLADGLENIRTRAAAEFDDQLIWVDSRSYGRSYALKQDRNLFFIQLGSEGKYVGELDISVKNGQTLTDVTHILRKKEFLEERLQHYNKQAGDITPEKYYADNPNVKRILERYQSELDNLLVGQDTLGNTIYWHISPLGAEIETDPELEKKVRELVSSR